MAVEITRVPDLELEELARTGGPMSVEARVLMELHSRRANDHQQFAFRIGDYYFVGPMPDARTELALIAFVDDEEDGDE